MGGNFKRGPRRPRGMLLVTCEAETRRPAADLPERACATSRRGLTDNSPPRLASGSQSLRLAAAYRRPSLSQLPLRVRACPCVDTRAHVPAVRIARLAATTTCWSPEIT